jgi:omega-hydroxy-beta-dihydromenaquinone-9 sulfotransferase
MKKKGSVMIDRPIFIVGSGRSGTTLFYDLMAGHRELGWFSSYVERFANLPWLAALNAFYRIPSLTKRYAKRRWFPSPVEAHMLWDLFHPVEDSMGCPPFTEQDAALTDQKGLRRFIIDVLRFSQCPRFVNKNTRNTRRVPYLHTLFPDAIFVHVIRDGRAAANSFLNVHWWPSLSLWWAGGKTPVQMQKEGLESILVAARTWKLEVERVLQDKENLAAEQYIEVRYEALVQDPFGEVERVLDFCDLPWTSSLHAHIDAFDIGSRNWKWKDKFSPEHIDSINQEIGSLLEQLGYV